MPDERLPRYMATSSDNTFPSFDARLNDGRVLLGGEDQDLQGMEQDTNTFLEHICNILDEVIAELASPADEDPVPLPIDVRLESITSRLDPPREGDMDMTLLPRRVRDACKKHNVAATIHWHESYVQQTNEIGKRLVEEYEDVVIFVPRGNNN